MLKNTILTEQRGVQTYAALKVVEEQRAVGVGGSSKGRVCFVAWQQNITQGDNVAAAQEMRM